MGAVSDNAKVEALLDGILAELMHINDRLAAIAKPEGKLDEIKHAVEDVMIAVESSSARGR